MILRLINPTTPVASRTRVNVEFELVSHQLVARFEVRDQPSPSVNDALAKGDSQWGVWDWDVVELFVRLNHQPTYYEFVVSPLGQHFELEIFEPRKRFNKEFRSGGEFKAERIGERDWNATMAIPLSRLGWDSSIDSIEGNAFAILGAAPRTYWSAFLPEQETPDFHLPKHFRALLR